jgi:hypothetical protein
MQFIQKKNRRQMRQHSFIRKPIANTKNNVVEIVEEKPVEVKKSKKTTTRVEETIKNNIIEENLE